MVALPAAGYREGGVQGAGIGLGKGIGAAVACVAVGTGAAAVQVGRGIYNTPEAVMASAEGKEWDERTHKWIHYNLPEEAELVLKLDEQVKP